MGQIAVDLVQIAFSVSVLTARQSLKNFFLHRNKGHRIGIRSSIARDHHQIHRRSAEHPEAPVFR